MSIIWLSWLLGKNDLDILAPARSVGGYYCFYQNENLYANCTPRKVSTYLGRYLRSQSKSSSTLLHRFCNRPQVTNNLLDKPTNTQAPSSPLEDQTILKTCTSRSNHHPRQGSKPDHRAIVIQHHMDLRHPISHGRPSIQAYISHITAREKKKTYSKHEVLNNQSNKGYQSPSAAHLASLFTSSPISLPGLIPSTPGLIRKSNPIQAEKEKNEHLSYH